MKINKYLALIQEQVDGEPYFVVANHSPTLAGIQRKAADYDNECTIVEIKVLGAMKPQPNKWHPV